MIKLKYPEGSIISYCDEYFKVLRNNSDYSGRVIDVGRTEINNFYFKYAGEESILIDDENKIMEIENWIQGTNIRKGMNPINDMTPRSLR